MDRSGEVRVPVGVLGATGLVGRRLLRRLGSHPWFRVTAVGASAESEGRRLGDLAGEWEQPLDPELMDLRLRRCEPAAMEGCRLVFSALDAEVAARCEPAFERAGCWVVSNSSALRMDPGVPLVIPEVNPDHLALLGSPGQAHRRVVTNPNCTTAGLALALAPLHRAARVRSVVAASLQAVSGAGASGPRALDLLDNVLPYIPGEEEKLHHETRKILGDLRPEGVVEANLVVSALCARVGVVHGHLIQVSARLKEALDPEEAVRLIREYRAPDGLEDLPSLPRHPLVWIPAHDRPQPRLDRNRGDGMVVSVGRVRLGPAGDLRFTVLVHNMERGAAGAAVANAELLLRRGWLE